MKYLFLMFLLSAQILVAQETRQIGPFDELVVSGKISVDLEQGDTERALLILLAGQ